MKKQHIILTISVIAMIISTTIALARGSFSNPDGEIKSLTFQSNNYGEPGSWKLEKNAKWIDSDKLEVTLDLNTIESNQEGRHKDVIYVFDDSGFFEEDKIRNARLAAHTLISSVLEDPENRLALMLNNYTHDQINTFSTDKNAMDEGIERTRGLGYTNYYHDLKKVKTLLENYEHQDNRDLIVILIKIISIWHGSRG